MASSRPGPTRYSGKMRRSNHWGLLRSLGLLACLFAFAARFSLPLLHSLHMSSAQALTASDFGFSLCPSDHRPCSSPLMVSGIGGEPEHHHDSRHCPVCLAISLSSTYAALHHDTESNQPLRSSEILSAGFGDKFATRFFSDCTARAPPSHV